MNKITKKIRTIFIILICCVITALCMDTEVFAAQASLTGPTVVRAGDNIALNLVISAQGSYGIEGKLSYDNSLVTLQGITSAVSGWKSENNGNTFLAYDDAMTSPLGNNATVLKITFKVNQNVATGTAINISATGIVATNGNSESNLGNAVYTVNVARPLSGNNSLSSINIDGVNLAPAFNENTLNYDAGEVEYSVNKLNVSAVPKEGTAKVSISGNSLNVGSNTIKIVVTAENGATKTYTVNVIRKQDPNYVASDNASLGSISLSVGILSPSFSPDITEYIVYLPNEIKTISATGIPADSKAQGVNGSGDVSLVSGENHISVVGKAEDGTEKEYRITVVVMPEYSGQVPEPETPTEETTEDATEPENEGTTGTDLEDETGETTTEVTEINYSSDNKNNSPRINLYIVIVLVVLAAAIGFFACYLWQNKRTKRNED